MFGPHLPYRNCPRNVSRLTPLAACLALAFALSPGDGAATPQTPHASVPSTFPDGFHPGFRRGHPGIERPGAAHARTVLTRPRTDRPASTRLITTCADDGSVGSLRSVMASAEDGDVIDMSQLVCSTITLTSGSIDFDVDDLTLQGPGQNALTIDGNNADRVFTIYSSSGTISINDLTIAHGLMGGTAYATGGCVYSYFATPDSLLVLTRVTVTSCTAGDAQAVYAGGGGVLTYGALTLVSSTISENHVTGGAGASYVAGGIGTLYNATIIDSTVTANTAIGVQPGTGVGFGAGLDLSGTPGTAGSLISGSTINGNVAASDAGGVYFFSPYLEPAALTATVINSTISGNVAATNAGLEVKLANVTLELENSTIAFNSADGACGGLSLAAVDNDLQSSIVAKNLGAAGADQDVCGPGAFDGANNLIMVSALSVPDDTIATDPILGLLQDNGGPTETHALQSHSPAIDTGNNNALLDFDQRGDGFPRVDGFQADIGAYEAHTIGDLVFASGFDP
jgi:hypothetical protein